MTSPAAPVHTRFAWWIGRWLPELCAVYPLLLLAGAYLLACLAAVPLGHWPRPSLDDPKDLPFPFVVLYVVYMLASTMWPVAPVFGLGAAIVHAWGAEPARPARVVSYVALAVCSLAIAYVIAVRDGPLEVFVWLAD